MLMQFAIWQQGWDHKLWFLIEVWTKSGDISSLWETLDRLSHFNFGSSPNYCKKHVSYLIDDLHAQFLYSSAAAFSALESTFLNQWYMWRWFQHLHGCTLVCGTSVELHQIVPVRYDVRDENSVRATIANSNVIVNCIGRHHLPHVWYLHIYINFWPKSLLAISKLWVCNQWVLWSCGSCMHTKWPSSSRTFGWILGHGHTHLVCIMCVTCHCLGREYETRNFSYDDVNYHNSNRISKVHLLLKFGALVQNKSCLPFKITSWLWQLILPATFWYI